MLIMSSSGTRTSCFLFLALFCVLHCTDATPRRRHQQRASAIVVGTVYCNTIFNRDLSKASHFIPGATVAVECYPAATAPYFRKEVRTDGRGVFRAHLPPRISANAVNACSVKLIRSSEPSCSAAPPSSSPGGLRLSSVRNGVRVFTAGPAFFFFPPPIPFLPSPPNVGGIPLPPNPLMPPPSLLPPVFPSPPPSLLPPVLPSPPPAPFIGIPPLPFVTPPPSPPPPASIFPPLPPFPLPPNPLFPGIPPASP